MKLIDGTKYFYILALKEINNVMSELKKLEVADDHEKTRLKTCIWPWFWSHNPRVDCLEENLMCGQQIALLFDLIFYNHLPISVEEE